MKSRRFFISLMISLFLNLCLLNIFSNILNICDFREKKEPSISTIDVVFFSADSFPQLEEETKNQPKLSEEKNSIRSSGETSNNENSTVLLENHCEKSEAGDKKANKSVPIAKKKQEPYRKIIPKKEKSIGGQGEDVIIHTENKTQSIIEIGKEQLKNQDIEIELKTKKQGENNLVLYEQNETDATQIIDSSLSGSSSSAERLENKEYKANEALDLTNSSLASEQIIPPKIISFLQPKYPENLRKREIEGSVELKVLIDKEGKVVKVEIYNSSGYLDFDEEAVQAIFKWHFEPAKSGNVTKNSWVLIPVTFKLK